MIAVKQPYPNLWQSLLNALNGYSPSYRVMLIIERGAERRREPFDLTVWRGWRALEHASAAVTGLNDIAARSRRPSGVTAVYYEVEEITNG